MAAQPDGRSGSATRSRSRCADRGDGGGLTAPPPFERAARSKPPKAPGPARRAAGQRASSPSQKPPTRHRGEQRRAGGSASSAASLRAISVCRSGGCRAGRACRPRCPRTTPARDCRREPCQLGLVRARRDWGTQLLAAVRLDGRCLPIPRHRPECADRRFQCHAAERLYGVGGGAMEPREGLRRPADGRVRPAPQRL